MTAVNDDSPTYSRDVRHVARHLLAHPGPIVILTHENPDGDAVGSVLGLSRALRSLGKTTLPVTAPPRYLRFLAQEGELLPSLEAWPEEALLAVLDVDNNDPVRVAGADVAAFQGDVVNVDHHGTNARRATAGVVDPSKPAAAMMVTDVILAMGVTLTEEIATPLMLGLITDTGSFRFESVTPDAFDCASQLRAAGARLGWLNDNLAQNPHSYYLLMREMLGSLEFLHGGQVVLARVDAEMLERAGATWEEVESYVSLLRNAEGSVLAVMVKDYGDRVKVSLRSRGSVSAQNVAVQLGGGGHVPAAGATVSAPYAVARPQLDAAIAEELSRVSRTAPS
jgi:phosphoesterase RecJ-like protein